MIDIISKGSVREALGSYFIYRLHTYVRTYVLHFWINFCPGCNFLVCPAIPNSLFRSASSLRLHSNSSKNFLPWATVSRQPLVKMNEFIHSGTGSTSSAAHIRVSDSFAGNAGPTFFRKFYGNNFQVILHIRKKQKHKHNNIHNSQKHSDRLN